MKPATRKIQQRAYMLVGVAALSGTPAHAGMIGLATDPNETLQLEFGVSRSVTLVSGTTGYVDASIRNLGTQAISFQEYDSTNPIGGFGWNFTSPGFAIGFTGVSLQGFQSSSALEQGVGGSSPDAGT